MANYPNLNNVKLEGCCKETIKRINAKLKIGNILSIGFGVAVWFNIFGPSPSPVNGINGVRQTDFQALEALVRATDSISDVSRAFAKQECQMEWLRHSGHKKLDPFWRAMIDAFSI